MSRKGSVKRALILERDEDVVYNFKVLLPNRTSVSLKLCNPAPEMTMKSFVKLVKEEYDKTRKKDSVLLSKKMRVDWDLGARFSLELNGERMIGVVRFARFKPDLCHIIRLDDGSGTASTMYENLWDLTPDTDLLKELPENYNFLTALADLIDNSLQAVWSYSKGERRLISVDVLRDRISIFDSGCGMDSSEANSIDKWGTIGASLHRSHKSCAIGGKPPYLKPYFGMFGYGGPYACMFLGRSTLVSSKTKESKKVFTLQLNKDALVGNRSISGKNWNADGGMRDPLEEEIKLSPHGSFTKVEIFESEFDISKIYQLQCRLKDIYFPYIQCDELSRTGKTERPVEFQVNGEDLAEIAGGEVATTNLNSKGQAFWFQIRFTVNSEKRKGTSHEANARLKFVYFPIVQGKESIEMILESLKEEGCKNSESFQTFGRVSVRRLGRLLPEIRWRSIPFMARGAKASTLQKCCQRVKCFVDLDAGFSPTPSKTDLASQNPFSVALRNFGSKSSEQEKDDDVNVVIHREGKSLSYGQVEQGYQDWVLEMHKTYDEEAASGEDDAILIVDSLDKKALGILRDAIRVHKEVKRKGTSWKRGQHIKILKGAYAGVHKNNIYATIDYFIIEGFEDESGGDTRIICRPNNCPENEECTLSIINEIPRLEVRRSLSLPISIIDSGKCLPVDADEWNSMLKKQQEKAPSKVDLLDEILCTELNIDGELPVGNAVPAGKTPPQNIVAVVRPACFTSSTTSNKLDQKHIVKMDYGEMLMVVKRLDANKNSSDKNAKPVCSQRCFATSRKGIHGLYIFSLGSKFPNLFKKAGTYQFSFSVGNSITCSKTVVVRPSKAARWKLCDNLESVLRKVCVGRSLPHLHIACLDEFENQIPFSSVPSLEVQLKSKLGFQVKIDNIEANLINSHSILKIENILVETDGLDQIRPDYEATIEICSKDKCFSISVACKVNPGPLERVVVNNPESFDNLLPDFTVENLILEMFDGYNNHVAGGTDVLIHTDGLCIQDWRGFKRKVDGHGCVDLSGILKVTAGYGKSVSLSVMSGNEEIFKKESQIEKRELRLISELPTSCAACSNLVNLMFKVTDQDGIMDTSIHHDEASGCFHTMSIESDSSSVESEIRYAFVHGSCKVPSLSLPEKGVFSFRVFHSRYPELHMSFKIQLTSSSTFERDEIGCSTPYSKMTPTPQSGMASTTNPRVFWTPTPNSLVELTPCSQLGVLAIGASSSAVNSETGLISMELYIESLKEKLKKYEECRVELSDRLKSLEAEKEQDEQEISTLQASLKPLGASFSDCLCTKESMMKQIEENHHDTAASVFCCLFRKAPPPKSLLLSMKGVFGLVALLGTVPSTSLSRVLSEYLGKDTMLALVCKSSRFGPNSIEYLRFKSEADKLGRSITSRFHVISLDATRPWKGRLVKDDPQRKLAIDLPKLPNGAPIPGFKGYAVNMIDLASEELNIQTKSGYGLRETLYYGVFGDLQIYETGKDLEAALPHINGGSAVSLDGLIVKENGFVYSGCSKPEIHFAITVSEDEEQRLRRLEEGREKQKMVEKIIEKEMCVLRGLDKKLKKTVERYECLQGRLVTHMNLPFV